MPALPSCTAHMERNTAASPSNLQAGARTTSEDPVQSSYLHPHLQPGREFARAGTVQLSRMLALCRYSPGHLHSRHGESGSCSATLPACLPGSFQHGPGLTPPSQPHPHAGRLHTGAGQARWCPTSGKSSLQPCCRPQAAAARSSTTTTTTWPAQPTGQGKRSRRSQLAYLRQRLREFEQERDASVALGARGNRGEESWV